jgi:hypothetical protein
MEKYKRILREDCMKSVCECVCVCVCVCLRQLAVMMILLVKLVHLEFAYVTRPVLSPSGAIDLTQDIGTIDYNT